ncbi:MAG: class IV adenylate cyclase [Patescibacteria group bacterium]
MEEFEIKFLEVNVPELEKKLLSIGAEKVGEYDQHMFLFDYPDFRLDKDHSWVKLRTNGKETTLSYKQRIGVKSTDGSIPDQGMKEIEVVVDNFEKVYEIFLAMSFVIKREVRNRRLRYKKESSVFDIDFWPEIPPYVEVEADSLENVKKAARELGFDSDKGLVCSPLQVYAHYGYDMDQYNSVTLEGGLKKVDFAN